MADMKLLLVEDNQQEINTCKATVKRYQHEKNRRVELVEKTNVSDALKILDNTFDGAIIDLKLGADGYKGNDVINEIASKYRIPIAVLTGHPRNAISGISLLHVYTRGETGYDEILDLFFQVYDTGLTKIFGMRGEIEEKMDKIFWKNILPSMDDWIAYFKNGKSTEKALLRFTVCHLLEILDDNDDAFFPEEMYIIPPLSKVIKTGVIVKRKTSENYYIVLSPACDLVLHEGKPKTKCILVCEIENVDTAQNIVDIKRNLFVEILDNDPQDLKNKKIKQQEKAKESLATFARNANAHYNHYLPKTKSFGGGTINFRNVETISIDNFENEFGEAIAQISIPFTKDIVARFSSYYARQGQPEFDLDGLIDSLKK
jgi:hypothetical protein